MKLTLLLLAVVAALVVAYPAMAFDTPSQGTDNATDVILWPGTSIPIILQGSVSVGVSNNITITSLQESMVAAGEAHATVLADEMMTIWLQLLAFMLVVSIFALAFWQKNAFLYLIATPVGLVYGLELAAGSTVGAAAWVIGIIVAIIGMFCLFRVVVNELLPIMRRRE